MLMSKIFNGDGGRRAVNCKLMITLSVTEVREVLIETGSRLREGRSDTLATES